jgi:hypothetical protein
MTKHIDPENIVCEGLECKQNVLKAKEQLSKKSLKRKEAEDAWYTAREARAELNDRKWELRADKGFVWKLLKILRLLVAIPVRKIRKWLAGHPHGSVINAFDNYVKQTFVGDEYAGNFKTARVMLNPFKNPEETGRKRIVRWGVNMGVVLFLLALALPFNYYMADWHAVQIYDVKAESKASVDIQREEERNGKAGEHKEYFIYTSNGVYANDKVYFRVSLNPRDMTKWNPQNFQGLAAKYMRADSEGNHQTVYIKSNRWNFSWLGLDVFRNALRIEEKKPFTYHFKWDFWR